jgi:hypothetical protein
LIGIHQRSAFGGITENEKRCGPQGQANDCSLRRLIDPSEQFDLLGDEERFDSFQGFVE